MSRRSVDAPRSAGVVSQRAHLNPFRSRPFRRTAILPDPVVIGAIALAACSSVLAPTAARTQSSGSSSAAQNATRLTTIDMVVHRVSDASLNALEATHVTSVRVTLYWALAASDPKILAQFCDDVRHLKTHGFDVLAVVHQEPRANRELAWADRVNAFADFLAPVVKQLPGTNWELFNEIDNDGFDNLFTTVSISDPSVGSASVQRAAGEHYGRFLSVVVPRLRMADPTARIVTAGINLNPGAFLRGVQATLSADTRLDAIAVHAYGYPVVGEFRSKYAEAHTVFPDLPIWATEFGMNDTQVPGRFSRAQYDSIQATQIAAAVAAAPGYARAYVYALWTGEDGEFALFRTDWSRRPAAAWIAAYNAGAR